MKKIKIFKGNCFRFQKKVKKVYLFPPLKIDLFHTFTNSFLNVPKS